MLIIAGTISIDPANREIAASAADQMMEATRKEPGCAAYTISGDLSDPGSLHLFEEWQDQAALDAHFATPHMASFREAMGKFGVRSMTVSKYEVSAKGPLR
jgi:quinol monooxygenase YgiN